MKIIKSIIVILLLTISVTFFKHFPAHANDCDDPNGGKKDCNVLIDELSKKLSDVRAQKNTLSSQIALMDTQINLTSVRIRDTEYSIEKTEQEILNLTDKIEGLNTSLDYLGKTLLRKIVEGYKRHDVPFLNIFLDSQNASVLLNRYKYAKTAEENDRRLAFQVQQAKLNFEEQKQAREEKRIKLDNLKGALNKQRIDLDNQKAAKQRLLADTQNDERNYQALLARARAEFAAIQGIISGAGTESEVRQVTKGQVIAVIATSGTGTTCSTTGAHLHFTVKIGGGAVNPFSKLRDIDHDDRSGGDTWNPSGDWDWPLNPKIFFNQGYGNDTSFIRSGAWYSFHDGIDINGSSYDVKTVADGTLYRGSYSVGCTLPYAKVVHKDSNISTLYLHTYVQ